MAVVTRELTARDRYALTALMRAVTGRAIDDRAPGPSAFLTDPATFVIGAYLSEQPVGWLWGNVQRRPDGRIATYVHELDVVAAARGQDVASMLVRATIVRARRAGHDRIWLVADAGDVAATELYTSLGGRRARRDDVVFVWDLTS